MSKNWNTGYSRYENFFSHTPQIQRVVIVRKKVHYWADRMVVGITDSAARVLPESKESGEQVHKQIYKYTSTQTNILPERQNDN